MLRAIFMVALIFPSVASAMNFPTPSRTRQAVVVIAPAWDSAKATLQRWARVNTSSPWEKAGAPVVVQVGERGLGWGRGLHRTPDDGAPHKVEGDRRAPAGVFRLTGAFGREPRAPAGVKLSWQAITPTLEAIDDPSSRFYNRIVDLRTIARPDWRSSERMAHIPDYALGIVVAHNPANSPGAGSCIFLHLWLGTRRGTAGCTVLRGDDLLTLLEWLDPDAQPVLIQTVQSAEGISLQKTHAD